MRRIPFNKLVQKFLVPNHSELLAHDSFLQSRVRIESLPIMCKGIHEVIQGVDRARKLCLAPSPADQIESRVLTALDRKGQGTQRENRPRQTLQQD